MYNCNFLWVPSILLTDGIIDSGDKLYELKDKSRNSSNDLIKAQNAGSDLSKQVFRC